jgi:hypothetical protein
MTSLPLSRPTVGFDRLFDLIDATPLPMSATAKKDLIDALTALIKERRLCAQLLSKPYERGTYEATMARFVELQTTIEALERALVSEADFP